MRNIIFINSHPIQYFAPMYKYMNEQEVKTEAWYCSNNSVLGGFDTEFGVNVKWDIPLLEGYKSRFFKNYSWKPGNTNGFFGLINFGMIREIFRIPKSIIIVHGWHYFTLLLIILLGKISGHVICLRNETPLSHENLKKGWKQTIKRIGLKYVLFPKIDYFLYIGTQNKLFYQSYNIADTKLIFCPYAVDNQRFQKDSITLIARASEIKANMGILDTEKIILYSAKYIDKKRPLDLIQAFIQLKSHDCWLILVGEGELRADMENLIAQHRITRVILTGFVNQSKISDYYAISDVFVMCSTVGETWGLSVNEAMNFNLPIILSDLTGSSSDLVKTGSNGYVFKTGDIDELTLRLRQVLIEEKLTHHNTSISIIDSYSYSTVTSNLRMIASTII